MSATGRGVDAQSSGRPGGTLRVACTCWSALLLLSLVATVHLARAPAADPHGVTRQNAEAGTPICSGRPETEAPHPPFSRFAIADPHATHTFSRGVEGRWRPDLRDRRWRPDRGRAERGARRPHPRNDSQPETEDAVHTAPRDPDTTSPDPIAAALATFCRTRIERRIDPPPEGVARYGLDPAPTRILFFCRRGALPAIHIAVGDLAPDALSRYVQIRPGPHLITLPDYALRALRQRLGIGSVHPPSRPRRGAQDRGMLGGPSRGIPPGGNEPTEE